MTATHILRISSHIGVAPGWIAEAARLEKGSKPAQWLCNDFPKHADDIANDPNTFLATLAFRLEQDYPNEYITLGITENILCKVCLLSIQLLI